MHVQLFIDLHHNSAIRFGLFAIYGRYLSSAYEFAIIFVAQGYRMVGIGTWHILWRTCGIVVRCIVLKTALDVTHPFPI